MEMIKVNWISVEDELPIDDELVMVCGCSNYGGTELGFTKFNRSRGWEFHRCNLRQVCFWVYYIAELPECKSVCECEDHIGGLNKMPKQEPNSWLKKLLS